MTSSVPPTHSPPLQRRKASSTTAVVTAGARTTAIAASMTGRRLGRASSTSRFATLRRRVCGSNASGSSTQNDQRDGAGGQNGSGRQSALGRQPGGAIANPVVD
ncbi:MAG: hypothetical protein QM619_11115 [Micropruina sp.]|uniref:hypothetical protein n=1 Tax=Micropruina sp. TaxID=2737536 RepID=UPI0039E64040